MKQHMATNPNLCLLKRLFVRTYNKTIINKSLAGLALCLFSAHAAFANLPEPMQQALTQAGISTTHVSLVILPISQNSANSTSRLTPLIAKNMPEPEPNMQDSSSALKLATANSSNNNNLNNGVFASTLPPLHSPIRHNANISRTPASTMKLITTFVALDLLGSDFRWMTHVYHTGYIIDNTLHGDLIIKGSGDPKLTHDRLEALLAKVNETGIRHIEGNIILDASVFKNVTKDPAAFDNEPLRSYNASPDGFMVNFNSIEITITLKPDNSSFANVYYVPQMADYILPNELPTRSGGCSNLRKKVAPNWQKDGLIFGRAVPKSCSGKTMYIAHPNAKAFAAYVTKQKWQALGNTIKGQVISTESPRQTNFGLYTTNTTSFNTKRDSVDNKSTVLSPVLPTSSPQPIVSYSSLPLSAQIYDINHYSNNVMTEQVLLSLPFSNVVQNHRQMQALPPLALLNMPASNYKKSLAKVSTWWQKTLETPPPYLTNGSGLCRNCTLTANNLVELLEYAYYHPEFATFASSMGIAGVSGTIAGHRRRLPNSAAIGQSFIKTGTLDNVTAMAGYVKGQSGQDYIVTGIINTPDKLNTTKARYALDTMLDWTARH